MTDPLPLPPSLPPSLHSITSSLPPSSPFLSSQPQPGDPGGIVSLSPCRFPELRNKRSLILIVQETAEGEGGVLRL